MGVAKEAYLLTMEESEWTALEWWPYVDQVESLLKLSSASELELGPRAGSRSKTQPIERIGSGC